MIKNGATGPRSAEGKLRASINAVKHGLAGKNLLLPGEDPICYERRMDEVFESLAPTDDAQAQVVALIGDDLWKLDRLARIEKGVNLGRIEELLATTQTAAKAAQLANAIVALGTALRMWECPFPAADGSEHRRRVVAMSEALAIAEQVQPESEAQLVEQCTERLDELLRAKSRATADGREYDAVFSAAVIVMNSLMNAGSREEAAQEELRRAIAEIALPDEAELKKLARYRRTLEEGIQRRLQVLEQLRKLSATKQASAPGATHEYRVRLRVVA